MTNPIRGDVRNFLAKYFNDNELTNLCFDYFPTVENNFTLGMQKDQKVRLLVEYCEHQGKVIDLLAALERERPELYQEELARISIKANLEPQKSEPRLVVRNPKQIFLSHSNQDAELAKRLDSALRAKGWATWIAPYSIQPGEKWVEAINRGLEECGIFILLLTKAAVRSPWVQSETNAAIQLEHQGLMRFVPLEVEPTKTLPLWAGYHWLKFRTLDETNLQALQVILAGKQTTETVITKKVKPKAARVPAPIISPEIVKKAAEEIRLRNPAKKIVLERPTTKPIREVPKKNKEDISKAAAVFEDNNQSTSLFSNLVWWLAGLVGLIVVFISYFGGWLTPLIRNEFRQTPEIAAVFLVTSTPLPTVTSTPLPTVTSTPLPTVTSTPLPTVTSTPLPTAPLPTAPSFQWPTPITTLWSTAAATSTPLPTVTSTPWPTATNIPWPTATIDPLIFWNRHDWQKIPAGNFLMGASNLDQFSREDELLLQDVYLDTYWISRYETTNFQYYQFLLEAQNRAHWPRTGSGCNWSNRGYYSGAGQYPVVCITWSNAVAYAEWLSRRTGYVVSLPSEAEWEKAARGTDGRIYPWGNYFESYSLNYCDRSCNYSWRDVNFNDGYSLSSPIGTYLSGTSPYGAEDMAGNVAEWVDGTFWGTSSYNISQGSSYLEYIHLAKGGDSSSSFHWTRTSSRNWISTSGWRSSLGFRVVIRRATE